MGAFLLWIFSGVVAAIVANSRGHSDKAIITMGVLGPLGLLAVLFLDPDALPTTPSASSSNDTANNDEGDSIWQRPSTEIEGESRLHALYRLSGSKVRQVTHPLGSLQGNFGANAILSTVTAVSLDSPSQIFRGIQLDVDGLNPLTKAPLIDCGPTFIDLDEFPSVVAEINCALNEWETGDRPKGPSPRTIYAKTRSMKIRIELPPLEINGRVIGHAFDNLAAAILLGSIRTGQVLFNPQDLRLLLGWIEQAYAVFRAEDLAGTVGALVSNEWVPGNPDIVSQSYRELRGLAHVGMQDSALKPPQRVGNTILSGIDVQVTEDVFQVCLGVLTADGLASRSELLLLRQLMIEYLPEATNWHLEPVQVALATMRGRPGPESGVSPTGWRELVECDKKRGSDLAMTYARHLLIIADEVSRANGMATAAQEKRLLRIRRALAVQTNETASTQTRHQFGPAASIRVAMRERQQGVGSRQAVLSEVLPAVVTVRVAGGHGSGFILGESNLVLTNHHVVAGADSVTLRFQDASERTAVVISFDVEVDVAVLRIEDPIDRHGLRVGVYAAEIGDDVLVIGSPVDENLSQTVTKGVVSGLRNSDRGTLLQIDAAVNRGNSGGPVLNTRGEAIGIVQAKMVGSGVEGLAFAIPIMQALSQLHIELARAEVESDQST